MIPEHNKIYELLTPSDNDADDLFNYLHSDDIGGRWLEAPENTRWEVDESRKRKNQDLISLNVRRTSDDVVAKGMNDSLAYSIHKFFGKRKKSDEEFGLVFYDEAASDRSTSNLTIIFSSLLPRASVFALYYNRFPRMRPFFIVLWSGVFSACLALFTTATRIQIFTASVAMASVQVVFMSTNGGPVP